MKKLPKIYQNQIEKRFKNNSTVYYSNSKLNNNLSINQKQNRVSVIDVLTSIRQEKGFIFNKPLLIKTRDNVYDTAIVHVNSNSIITLNEDIIKIEDILSITRK